MLDIIVEGSRDALIVEALLDRARVSRVKYRISVATRHLGPGRRGADFIRLAADRASNPLVVVYDQESGTVADAPPPLEHDQEGIVWCPAIPQIEAWLFADEQALDIIQSTRAREIFERLPSPEHITYPKVLASRFMRSESALRSILNAIDIDRAAARSPSLRNFLDQVSMRTGNAGKFDSPTLASNQFDPSIINALISEVYPGDSVIFRSSDGVGVTATEMIRRVEVGDAIGREYTTAILRVARDLLKRQAQKFEQKK